MEIEPRKSVTWAQLKVPHPTASAGTFFAVLLFKSQHILMSKPAQIKIGFREGDEGGDKTVG